MTPILYRAHTVTETGESTCRDRKLATDEGWQTCTCPIRVKGWLKYEKRYLRKACKTNVWSEAEKIVKAAVERGYWIDPDQLTASGEPATTTTVQTAPSSEEPAVLSGSVPLVDLIDQFIVHKQSAKARRQITATSVPHFYTLFGYPEDRPPQKRQKPRTASTLKATLATKQMEYAAQVKFTDLTAWTETWRCARKQHGLRIGRVIEFFQWLVTNGHLEKNTALGLAELKPILTQKDNKQRQPFDDEVVARLLDCALALPRNGNGVVVQNAEIQALILLMLRVGPGLADASALNVENLTRDRATGSADWTYRRIKNGVIVDTAIEPGLMQMLDALPKYPGGFFFYNGSKGTKARTTYWQQLLNLVFDMARVKKGDSGTHRFRHTYAYKFLTNAKRDGGMYELSKLLGHRNPSTTEKYYSHYLAKVAERMRVCARSVWDEDDLADLVGTNAA